MGLADSPSRRRPLRSEAVTLVAASAGLGAAFVWLPALLVGGATASRSTLGRSTVDAVTAYWRAGRAPWTDDLTDLLGQWRAYHLVKAAIAGVALLVFLGAARRQRGRAGAAAIGGAALTSVLVLVANIQGTVAPFASLLSLLPTTSADASFAPTSAEIRAALTERATSDRVGPPPLERMIESFVAYHAVLAVLAGALAVLAVASVVRSCRRPRRGSWTAVAVVAVLGMAAGLLCAANVSTALRPVPALRDAFG